MGNPLDNSQSAIEITVKPGNHWCLRIVNSTNDWLYKILGTDNICKVENSDLSLNPYFFRNEEITLTWSSTITRDEDVQFSEKWIQWNDWAEKKEVTWDWNLVFWKKFEKYNLVNMDWIIELNNWKFLINRYWKYQPNLSFISEKPEVKYTNRKSNDFNLPKWSFSIIYWTFFKSKKWTDCFRILPKDKAEHILICDDRWWAFNKYRWHTLPENNSVYYRRASSNWGWAGYDYWIYSKDRKHTLDEENI